MDMAPAYEAGLLVVQVHLGAPIRRNIMQRLTPHFQKVNLPVIVTDKPFARGRGTDKIFQMTIEGNRPETFRIFKGVGNDVKVVATDAKKQQVLLTVKEPKRVFIERVWDKDKHREVDVERVTSEELRRYLCGMDERHLFISELPKGTGKINTVDDAHRWLKPKEWAGTNRRKDAKVKRQGEWFFVDVTEKERELIEEKKLAILKDTALPTRGKKHTCDFYLKVGDVIFIMGRVRHADHKTALFSDWQRVYRNNETATDYHKWID